MQKLANSNKIDILDYGFVRLVDHMGGDISVSRAARVSYNAAWRAGEDAGSDKRLINYLWKNRHTSPFEAVTLTFEVKAPIFVFRQWQRHRTWSYNELSARYKALPKEFYVPEPANIGKQSKTNKQGRDLSDSALVEERKNQTLAYIAACKNSYDVYTGLLEDGWPKELARCVLPLAMYSIMFATVNLRNLFHFLETRRHLHAQLEIRAYENAMVQLAEKIAPVSVGVWKEDLENVETVGA